MIEYQVWLLGYDKNDHCTDFEAYLGSYPTKRSAVSLANQISGEIIHAEKHKTTKIVRAVVEKIKLLGNEEVFQESFDIKTFCQVNGVYTEIKTI